jgi:hypothetical protein
MKTILLALPLVLLIATSTVNAREYTKTISGPKGTASKVVDIQRKESGYTRSATVTGPQGKTASRDTDVTIDKDNRSLTKDITLTNPEGNTKSYTVTKKINP